MPANVKLTYKSAAAGARKVHALAGGRPGTLDDRGRPRYFSGVTWCGVEERSKIMLVETDRPVTCKTCLSALAAARKK